MHTHVLRDAASGRPGLALVISVLSGCTDCFIISPIGICKGYLMDVAYLTVIHAKAPYMNMNLFKL